MNAPDSTTTKAAAGRGGRGSRVNLYPIMELPEPIMRTNLQQNLQQPHMETGSGHKGA